MKDLIRLGLIPLVAIAAGFVIALVLTIVMVKGNIDSNHRQALIDAEARALASRINASQSTISTQLNGIAGSLRLSKILDSGDPTVLLLEESSLTEQIPNAIRVRLFPRGAAQVQRDTIPAFSYPSLDLVNRAEAGEAVFLEALSANSRWMLTSAAPIVLPGSDNIKGTLFVYLDIHSLSGAWVADIPGEAQLLQAFGDAEPSVIIAGGKNPTNGPAHVVGTATPHWQVSLRPNADLAHAQVTDVPALLIAPGVLFLLALGGLSVGVLQARAAINNDAIQLSVQMSGAAGGGYNASRAYRFTQFLVLDSKLRELSPSPAPAPATAPTPTPVPAVEPHASVAIQMVENRPAPPDSTGMIEDISEDDLDIEKEELNPEGDDDALLTIFRAYDIRGVVNETLTEDVIYNIGLEIGTRAEEKGEQAIVVGADGRVSSPDVSETLIRGLLASGHDVINIGAVPTPLVYFATHNSDATSGVIVTGSHNPPDQNVFKIVLAGDALTPEEIHSLYDYAVNGDLSEGDGALSEADIVDDYMDAIADVVVAQPLKVVVDCGNGVAGNIAPELYSTLGCDVIPLFCDVDGEFPNHPPPDLTVFANLAELQRVVTEEGADLGLAFDGDGDRQVAVDSEGTIISPDRLLMLFAKDRVSRNPGSDVGYDIKCTRALNTIISSFGGRPIMCRSGHSFLKAKVKETSAALGGELTGHICFSERWFGFDDALYSGARLLEVVGSSSASLTELMAEFPTTIGTPETHVKAGELQKFEIVAALLESGEFEGGTITDLDGLRIDYEDGWGLVRASNTGAELTLRFEADTDEALGRIQATFRDRIYAIDDSLELPF